MTLRRLVTMTVLLTLGLGPMTNAQAAELKVIAGGGIKGPLDELAAQYERGSGHKLVIAYGATPDLVKQLGSGTPFDLGVAPREVFADAAAKARFAAGSATIARVGFGVAVRAGTPKPDIATAETFKAALLRAQSIATLPASAAGAAILKTFDRLDIADEMKAKIKVQSGPAAIPQAVAKGDAELGIFLINVLMAPGVELAGPFPGDLQQELIYLGALSADTKDSAAAKAFIAFLKSPNGAAVLKAKGMTPG